MKIPKSLKDSDPCSVFVARELAPAGLRSGPHTSNSDLSGRSGFLVLHLLRSRTGASSLATVGRKAETLELELYRLWLGA